MKTFWASFCENPREETFLPFYERSKGIVYTLCRRVLCDEDDAQDAFQGVYDRLLAVAVCPEERRKVEDVEAFVRRLAVCEADRLRKARQRRLSKELAMNPLPERPASQPSVRDQVEAQLQRARIEALVATLPDRYRLPILLHYFDGMTHEQVSQTLGLSLLTVRTQIYRALKKLRPLFRRAGVGEAPMVLAGLALSAALMNPPAALGASAVLAHAQAAALAGASAAGASAAVSSSWLASSLWSSLTGIILMKMKIVVLGLVCLIAVLSLFVVANRSGRSPAVNPPASPDAALSPSNLSSIPQVLSPPTDAPTALATPLPLPKTETEPLTTLPDSPTTGPRAIVSGRVFLAPDYVPAAGAIVEALVQDSDPDRSWQMRSVMPYQTIVTTRTDSQGRYRMEIPDQKYWWQLRASRPASATVVVRMIRENSQSLEGFDLAPGLPRRMTRDIVLPPASELRGHVVDEKDRPIAKATIYVIAPERTGQTNTERQSHAVADAVGEFSLDDVPAGDLEVYAFAPGHSPVREIHTAPNTEARIRLAAEGASISGRIFHAESGKAIEGLSLSALPAGNAWRMREMAGDWFRATTAADGTFCFERLAPGEYSLVVNNKTLDFANDQEINTEKIILAALEKRENVELFVTDAAADGKEEGAADSPPVTRLSGRVVHSQGLPLVDGMLEVYQAHGAGSHPRGRLHPLNADGNFDVEVTQAKIVRLVARAQGFAPSPSEVLSVADAPISGIQINLVPGFSIFGTVVDSREQPVPYATIMVGYQVRMGSSSKGFCRWTASSDRHGKFLLADLPAGKVFLNVEREGYAFLQQEVTLDDKQPIASVRLVLNPGRFLAGRVTDELGNPVEGAEVRVGLPSVYPPTPGKSFRFYVGNSDAGGFYRVEGIPEGDTYHVAATEGDMADVRTLVRLDRDDEDFVLRPKDKPYLLGTVVDHRTRTPISDFRVSIEGYCYAEKDPDNPGVFRMKGHNDWDTCKITLSAEGYATAYDIPIRLSRDPKQARRVFELGPGMAITGRVVAGGEKTPQSGMRIQLRSSDGRQEGQTIAERASDADGKFVFQNIASGEYSIVIDAEAPRVPLKKYLLVKPDEPLDMGDLELGGGATIQGRVIHRPGEQGVPGMPVVLGIDGTPHRTSVTDADGRFAFTALPNDTYHVSVDSISLKSHSWNIPANSNYDLLFVVGDTTLRGKIVRKDLLNINAVEIFPWEDRNRFPPIFRSPRLESDGRFVLNGLAPGRYGIIIRHANYAAFYAPPYCAIFDVPPTGVFEKVFVIPTGRIVGRVVNARGEGVARATVSVNVPDAPADSHDSQFEIITKDDGGFVIEEMKEGLYDLTVTHGALGRTAMRGVAVPANGDSLPVEARFDTR